MEDLRRLDATGGQASDRRVTGGQADGGHAEEGCCDTHAKPPRGPPTDSRELVQAHDDRDAIQASPDELPAIDIHSL